MKRSIEVSLILLCLSPLLAAGQGPKVKRGTDYPLTVHIGSIHIRSHCTEVLFKAYCADMAYLDVSVDGHKFELMGDWNSSDEYQTPLTPGDYRARILEPKPSTGAPFRQKYELVLSDQTTWRATVTGLSE